MKRTVHAVAALAASTLLYGAPAWAQESAVTMPPQPLPESPVVERMERMVSPPPEEPAPGTIITTTEESTPDYGAIGGGALVFAGAYVGSVVVAGASSHPGDEHLFIPIVGPWVDLADRHCVAGISCGKDDTGNKALLVLDGVAQDAGVIAVATGLIFPEHRLITRITELDFAPVLGSGIFGMRASGVF